MKKYLDLNNCDLIKTCMMLLVVIYHCMVIWAGGWFQEPANKSHFFRFLSGWLNSFHIYVFIFISGYIFCYLKYEKNKYKYLCEAIVNRFKRLVYPYIFIVCLWGIPFYIITEKVSLVMIIKKYVLGINPSQYWFLLMLFWVSCFFYIISDFVKERYLIWLFVFYIIYGVSHIISSVFPNFFQILSAMKYSLFFYLGFLFRKENFKKVYDVPWGILSLLTFLVWYYSESFSIVLVKIIRIGFYPIVSVCGIFMVVTVMSKIDKEKLYKNKLYLFFEKYNFTIYLFHQQLIYISIIMFNDKVNNFIFFWLNLLFALGGSAIISVISCKFSWMKRIMHVK